MWMASRDSDGQNLSGLRSYSDGQGDTVLWSVGCPERLGTTGLKGKDGGYIMASQSARRFSGGPKYLLN